MTRRPFASRLRFRLALALLAVCAACAVLAGRADVAALRSWTLPLGAGLTGALATLVLLRSHLRPIRHLIHATERIGSGEFDGAPPSADFRGELGVLARALAAASSRVETAQAELIEAKADLERKVLERTHELQELLDEAHTIERMKDGFLSSVSHEFRTPLASIRAYSEILLKFEDEDRDTQREFLGIIISESDRLTRLVGNILDLVKIESGGASWSLREIQVLEVAADAVRTLRPILDKHGMRAVIRRPDDAQLTVRADRDRILQVLSNLLSNAIKFSHEGDAIEIEVSVRNGATHVEIVVADHGIGIAAEDQEAIFERFKQLGDTLTAKPAGFGLGLPICKEIVERHGGRIWAESALARGSRFHFTLPVTGPSDDELKRGRAAAGAPI